MTRVSSTSAGCAISKCLVGRTACHGAVSSGSIPLIAAHKIASLVSYNHGILPSLRVTGSDAYLNPELWVLATLAVAGML